MTWLLRIFTHGANDPEVSDEDMNENEQDMIDCSAEELERWKQLYDEVMQEGEQQGYPEICKFIWTYKVSQSMRNHVVEHTLSTVRMRIREYLKLTQKKTNDMANDSEVKQWRRLLNAHFVLIFEIHMETRRKDEQMAQLQQLVHAQPAMVTRGTDSRDRKGQEKSRFERGLARDRIQLHVHFDHEKGDVSLLGQGPAGAWEHVSCYEDALRS